MIIENPGVLLAATTAAERTYRDWEGDAVPLTIPNIPPRRAEQ